MARQATIEFGCIQPSQVPLINHHPIPANLHKVSDACSRDQPKQREHLSVTMSVACAHSFQMIKSETTLVQWLCHFCRSGPHWAIFECSYCKLQLCRACTKSA
ncbi:uncharacterized protein F5Z01DRAFT_10965 [Emericellopsis atlantica]|uniref:Uncharacterized protein n=1 Tax=Emericellopsis atlantica TaxID=2614577 RepID=A0A9P7ZWB1_9HYPO|nr:uncharacterized protein F5Z01DRAFT_10965 [Emericellopsis atlantica]KAG9258952.1 hypothetical protein F5Z01DRAFT_10965 [Emericellopsis atlantica]